MAYHTRTPHDISLALSSDLPSVKLGDWWEGSYLIQFEANKRILRLAKDLISVLLNLRCWLLDGCKTISQDTLVLWACGLFVDTVTHAYMAQFCQDSFFQKPDRCMKCVALLKAEWWLCLCCSTDLHRASDVTISSISLLTLLRVKRGTASFPTTTLVHQCSDQLSKLRLTNPPGGLNAQHFNSAWQMVAFIWWVNTCSANESCWSQSWGNIVFAWQDNICVRYWCC